MDDDAISRQAADLRDRSWRQEHRIEALNDTIAVLRAGADALATENLELRLELAELRRRRPSVADARSSVARRPAHRIRRR